MNTKPSACPARLLALLVCALALGMAAAPSYANVYASELKWSAPAVDASQPSATVDLSFRLNEAADQAVRVDIYRADTNVLVRSVDLGSKLKGVNTYTWDLKDNSNAAVPKNIEYYFKVYTRASGYGSWTQISDDNEQGGWFEWPQNLAVNTNPNSPYFGRVYIVQARDGTPAGGTAQLKGLYMMNSDNTAVGAGPYNGGQIWAVSATFSTSLGGPSPFKVKVGPDDKVYIADWSDVRGGVMVAPPDLSGTFQHLLDPNIIAGTGGQSADAAVTQHGSVSDVLIVGKGLDRKLYTIDEDLRTTADLAVGKTNGSIWRYDIGALDQVYSGLGAPFWIDGDGTQPNRINNLACGLARDAQGNVYISQYRSNGTDTPSLLKISPTGANPPLWQSLANWGSPDPLRGARGTGVAVDDARSRIATSSAEQGVIFVMDKSLALTSLTQVGGGAIAWTAGASSAAGFASAALTGAFAAQTPPAGIQFNDVACDGVSATAGTTNGWAVADGGNIVKITGRTTWAAETSPTTENLNGVVSVRGTPMQSWAVGNNGAMVRNLAGTWETETVPVSTRLNAVAARVTAYAALPAYDLYVVGDGGTILQRVDATNATTPTSWALQTSNTTNNLNDISVLIFAVSVATSKAYAVGDAGTILKTLDGGTTWQVQTSGTTANLRGVCAVTATNAWAVGDGGVVLRTVDGTTWAPVTSGTTANLRSVYFKDTQNGWAVGDGGVAIRTRNGGTTWSVMTSGTTQNLRSVYAMGVGSGAPRGVAFDAAGNLYESNNSSERIRVYSPPDGLNEFTTTGPFKFVPTNGDATKPAAPVVTAPAVSASTNTLSASWTATGSAYQYALGVTAEDQGDYVVGWTDTPGTSVTKPGLTLVSGVTYFWYVRARSANGVWSDVGISGGTLVQEAVSIGTAKTRPDGTLVALTDKVVTKISGSEFFIQEQDRSAGVRVVVSGGTPVVALDTLVTVTGNVGTSGAERVINAAVSGVTSGAAFTAVPLQTTSRDVGGQKVTGGSGLPDDGLLATVWGKVTGTDFFSYLYVDDGSDVPNDATGGEKGIKIDLTTSSIGTLPATNQYVKITGVVRAIQAGSNVIRVIQPRNDSDVVIEQ